MIRSALAWVFIYNGGGKLFGWFHRGGIHAYADFFATTAHLHPGTFFAVLSGVTEFGGGVALAIGLLSRLASLALVGDMVMAMITVTFRNGLEGSSLGSGYELNIALAALALSVVLLGAGRYSLDSSIGTLFRRRRHIPTQ
jgi:putative oxidoreductase